jgi:Cu-Zn family superoxide dismutase
MQQKIIILLLILSLFFGCKSSGNIGKAVVRVFPTNNNKVSGLVVFQKTSDGVRITGKISGLTKGKHGFHIHEFGDLSKTDGTSAGGHFNPFKKQHGAPDDKERHAGDLGNIIADDNGMAKIDMTDKIISLNGKNSIIGRAIIIHAGEDDLKTQPTGNAGKRVGYGVIGIGNK